MGSKYVSVPCYTPGSSRQHRLSSVWSRHYGIWIFRHNHRCVEHAHRQKNTPAQGTMKQTIQSRIFHSNVLIFFRLPFCYPWSRATQLEFRMYVLTTSTLSAAPKMALSVYGIWSLGHLSAFLWGTGDLLMPCNFMATTLSLHPATLHLNFGTLRAGPVYGNSWVTNTE